MHLDRRRFLAISTATALSAAARPAYAAPVSGFGVDAAHFGLRPGSHDDQSKALQRAIDETARGRQPLAIAPGNYRVGISGCRRARRSWACAAPPSFSFPMALRWSWPTTPIIYRCVRSTGQCNTACSLSAGVWKPKVFRGR